MSIGISSHDCVILKNDLFQMNVSPPDQPAISSFPSLAVWSCHSPVKPPVTRQTASFSPPIRNTFKYTVSSPQILEPSHLHPSCGFSVPGTWWRTPPSSVPATMRWPPRSTTARLCEEPAGVPASPRRVPPSPGEPPGRRASFFTCSETTDSSLWNLGSLSQLELSCHFEIKGEKK